MEASLGGLLILPGVRPGTAFLATLAYRVAAYWFPLLAGPPSYRPGWPPCSSAPCPPTGGPGTR